MMSFFRIVAVVLASMSAAMVVAAQPEGPHDEGSDRSGGAEHVTASEQRGPINPALRRDRANVATSNVLPLPSEEPGSLEAARMKIYEERLELARRLRQQKSVKVAQEKLEELLYSAASLELKQTALIELALMAEEEGQHGRAQQIYAQFVQRYSEHPDVPEILLRQGLLYRQMGAPTLALSKFYGVMNTALHVQAGSLSRHRRLVLQAQTEIAETYYLQGNYQEAGDFLRRLLKLEEPDLNVAMIEFKLIRCLGALGRDQETILRGKEFLERHAEFEEIAEVRFELALALKRQGKNTEALAQLSELLNHQQSLAERDLGRWRYWQQRVGNEVANQLYQQGDYVHALELYRTLSDLSTAPSWQLPVWYQMALSYERLEQPAKAAEMYQRILARQSELKDETSAALRSVTEMARWRVDFLQWQAKALRQLSLPKPSAAVPAAASPGHDRAPTSG